MDYAECAVFYGNLRADRVVRPYKEAERRIRIRRAYSEKSASSWVCLGATGRPRMVAEGVVAEAAAAVVAGDDAAELADHRFIVNFPRELAIGTVAVDLLSEQHGAAAFL